MVFMYGLLCLLAALLHILDPWNALPFTRKGRTSPFTLLELLLLIRVFILALNQRLCLVLSLADRTAQDACDSACTQNK